LKIARNHDPTSEGERKEDDGSIMTERRAGGNQASNEEEGVGWTGARAWAGFRMRAVHK
jgi:hypothetical protein